MDSLGLTTCLTGTDTAGTDFNKGTAAAVIAEVDGTSASVSVALENLNSGSLEGQVPGVGLINTLATAQAAQATFETANKAAVEALATKLEVVLDTADSFEDQLADVKLAADQAREAAGTTGVTPEASTSVLEVRVSDAKKALETARNASDNDKTAAAAYEAAYNKDAATKAADLDDIAAATTGLDAVANVTTSTTGILAVLDDNALLVTASNPAPAFTDSQDLYDYYTDADTTTAQRNIVDAAFKDVSFFSTFKATASVDVADKAAAAALLAADVPAVSGAFKTAVLNADTASATFEAAKLADVDKAAADALTASHDAAQLAVTQAGTALDTYNLIHTDTQVVELASVSAVADVKEAFYFGDKATAADDFTIGNTVVGSQFGAGDAIVLGTGYSFNSGALSTGDNNKLEFFFVKTDAGTQVVIETANYGSGAATPSATTGVPVAGGDNLAVITLTGVTADHLAVNNGVVSYV